MPTFRLVLEYDGTDFAGWQSQAQGERTVQATLAAALAEFGKGPVRVAAAGRTDAGVHAEGQVAAVTLETRLDIRINSYRRPDWRQIEIKARRAERTNRRTLFAAWPESNASCETADRSGG